MTDPLVLLSSDPAIQASSTAAQQACEQLRWHPALRRRAPEVSAEGWIHTAHATAKIEGAGVPLTHVRRMSLGAQAPNDASGELTASALRIGSEAAHLAAQGGKLWSSAARQALARLHTAGAAGRFEDGAVGRPRSAATAVVDDHVPRNDSSEAEFSERLAALSRIPAAAPGVPAVLVGALVWAEVVSLGVFSNSNGLVGRAAFRSIIIGRGLDPLGVCVPEPVIVDDPATMVAAMKAYQRGDLAGLREWVDYCASLVVKGCGIGERICQGVLAGTFPT